MLKVNSKEYEKSTFIKLSMVKDVQNIRPWIRRQSQSNKHFIPIDAV